ncbi:hypothetical protein M3647_22275 [Paenibacillus cellulositrophicus]|uniref:hypothetical protein n=1 Tax=Paenibacillus cellulositrophicus TaxID=562959 RepID=UPI00203B2AD3|nr:hypothetical protein [Paenibacillus cellulositrophicus]MCM3000206.1 hypothetical protein [Paenibacillus cellulositrophicus]
MSTLSVGDGHGSWCERYRVEMAAVCGMGIIVWSSASHIAGVSSGERATRIVAGSIM